MAFLRYVVVEIVVAIVVVIVGEKTVAMDIVALAIVVGSVEDNTQNSHHIAYVEQQKNMDW